jgi:hypothetical protein
MNNPDGSIAEIIGTGHTDNSATKTDGKIAAQSQTPTPPITPCPSGLTADVAYGLFQMGKNAATVGKAAVALGTGAAIIAAPASPTPPGLAAEGVAGTVVAAGGMTTLTGYSMQLLGGGFLAFQGDSGPLDSVLASALNLNVPFVPSITPTNPFSSSFSSQAGASTCGH